MTTLSDRLHAAVDALPATLPPAAQVRRSAERRQRARTVVGTAASLAVGLTAVAGLAVVRASTDDARVTLVPASAPPPVNVITDEVEQRAARGSYTPLADPFLTERDWDLLATGMGVSRRYEPVSPLALQACGEQLPGAGLREARSAQWVEPARRARQIETVLTYTDAGAASSGVVALLEAFQRCSARLGSAWQGGGLNPPELPDPYSLTGHDFPAGAVDEGFVIERFSEVVAPDGPVPNVNQLGAARDGNVVVVVESTGWGDRTNRTLEIALSRALGNQGGRCGVAELDHRQVECPSRP